MRNTPHLMSGTLKPIVVLFSLLLPAVALGQRSLETEGDSLYAHFENVRALEAYREAYDRSPSYTIMFKRAVAANEIAQDLQAEERRDEAKQAFERAVEYSEQLRDAYPQEAGSWFILAATTGKLAQFSGGRTKVRIGRAVEEYYRKSLALDSTYALAHLVGGVFNREVAQLSWIQRLAANTLFGGIPDASLEESRALLERALELEPTLFMGHWELAQTLKAMGEDDRAEEHLRFIQVLSPRSTEEQRIRARVREMLLPATPEQEEAPPPNPHQ